MQLHVMSGEFFHAARIGETEFCQILQDFMQNGKIHVLQQFKVFAGYCQTWAASLCSNFFELLTNLLPSVPRKNFELLQNVDFTILHEVLQNRAEFCSPNSGNTEEFAWHHMQMHARMALGWDHGSANFQVPNIEFLNSKIFLIFILLATEKKSFPKFVFKAKKSRPKWELLFLII